MRNNKFDKEFKEFDKQFESGKKLAIIWLVFVVLFEITALAGIGFVVYRLIVDSVAR